MVKTSKMTEMNKIAETVKMPEANRAAEITGVAEAPEMTEATAMKRLERRLRELAGKRSAQRDGQVETGSFDQMMEQFSVYRREILLRNQFINLTAITDPAEFEEKHFLDSLTLCDDERMAAAGTVLDVGTGAGFPGIPLAIVFPEKKFTLMDSLGKRVNIVRELAEKIGLKNVEAVHARAEELAKKKEYREQYDICVSRAVANMSTLSEYCLPFVKTGGWFVPYKTADAEEEIAAAVNAIHLLGGELQEKQRIKNEAGGQHADGDCGHRSTAGTSGHLLVWVRKQRATPAKYPRKAGTPAKEPLK